MYVSTDPIVNNEGGANLKERWMAREMSTDSLLSALLSKEWRKGKEVRERKEEQEEERRALPPEVLEKRKFCFHFAVCLSVCLCLGMKSCAFASRPGQPHCKLSLILV